MYTPQVVSSSVNAAFSSESLDLSQPNVQAASLALTDLVLSQLQQTPPQPFFTEGQRSPKRWKVDPVASAYVQRVKKLVFSDFPFAQVERGVAQKAILDPGLYGDLSLPSFLNQQLEKIALEQTHSPYSLTWKEIDQLVDHLNPKVVMQVLSDTYAQSSISPVSSYSFLLLLQLVFKKKMEIPNSYRDFLRIWPNITPSMVNLEQALRHYFSTPFAKGPVKWLRAFVQYHGKENLPFFFNYLDWEHFFYTHKLLAVGQETHEQQCEKKGNLESLSPSKVLFSQSSSKLAPESIVRRVPFLGRKVLSQGSVLMGIVPAAPHAFSLQAINVDPNQEALVWEHSVEHFTADVAIELIAHEKEPLAIALLHAKDRVSTLIDLKNATQRKLTLPVAPQSKWDRLHITSSHFAYFLAQEKGNCLIFGGQIAENWEPKFNFYSPFGHFKPLGPYLQLSDPFHLRQTIVDQSGQTHQLFNCKALQLQGNSLYTLEKGNHWQLARQEIASGPLFQLKGKREEMLIGGDVNDLVAICDDGTCIMTAPVGDRLQLLFVNLEQKTADILPTSLANFSEKLVDTKRNMIWTWSYDDQTLWRHSRLGSEKVCPLPSNGYITLLHIDERGRVYYSSADIQGKIA